MEMKIKLFLCLWVFALTLSAQTSTFHYDANGNQTTRSRPAISYLVNVSPDTTIKKGTSVRLFATGGDDYLWSNGATTAEISVRPDSTMRYGVRVHCICGALITDTVEVKVLQTTKTEAPPQYLRLDVFPNPTNDAINVQFQLPQTADVVVQIVDETGRLLMSKQIPKAGSVQIYEPLTGYANGTYFLRLNYQNHSETRRFTVMK